MNKIANVMVLVEGKTELFFIKNILAPYLAHKNVFLRASILTKPGQPGSNKFVRAKKDIGAHLKQRANTWLTLLVDYYGIDTDWPGYEESKKQNGHARKHWVMCEATKQQVGTLFAGQDAEHRFIPYISMHEFEALLFSDPAALAGGLGVDQSEINNILQQCGEPEAINDSRETSPSHRLDSLSPIGFKKTTTGITIAEQIGIDAMRNKCPLFNDWINQLEALTQ